MLWLGRATGVGYRGNHDQCDQQNEIYKAIKSYQTVLFLKSDFALAHFKLARLYQTDNREKDAKKSYENVLKSISNMLDPIFLKYSGGGVINPPSP